VIAIEVFSDSERKDSMYVQRRIYRRVYKHCLGFMQTDIYWQRFVSFDADLTYAAPAGTVPFTVSRETTTT